MPRRQRMYIPGYTYHVVQRGNNREACFFEEENYRAYLQLLREVLPRYGAQLHAYCLMTNHVHLLLTPEAHDSISNLLKVVCSRYANRMNKKYHRTGTLWEGRHKASPVDLERYLLKCYRYIELNPVAAHMVRRPEMYCWTSYHANAWGDTNQLITPHPVYLVLADSVQQRCYRYREMFQEVLSPEDVHAIREAIHYSMPVGSDRFRQQIEQKLGRSLGQVRRGRPRLEVG